MRAYVRALTVMASAVTAAVPMGCLGPRQTEYQSSRALSISETSQRADALWEAAKETLRRHQFRLERVDRRAGIITTMPIASQHFFEFWRHDVATAPDFWDATINPIRRRVELKVTWGDEGTRTRFSAVVRKERLSSPDRQFNRTGAVYQYFGNRLPSTTGLERVTGEQDEWLDLGRDPAMEDYLLRAILERAGVSTASDQTPSVPTSESPAMGSLNTDRTE